MLIALFKIVSIFDITRLFLSKNKNIFIPVTMKSSLIFLSSFLLGCFSFLNAQDSSTNPISVAVIGGGPAGLTAALYSARSGLECVLFQGDQPGGQLIYSSEVENYPGIFPSKPGLKLIELMQKQAINAGAHIKSEWVKNINFKVYPFEIHLANDTVEKARVIILALGSKPKQLGLESEKFFWGKGVSSCALCDGALYKNEEVVVVGGGDAAFDEALFLSKIVKKVTVVNRSDKFRANYFMQELVRKRENIEIRSNQIIDEILGSEKEGVVGIRIHDATNNRVSQISCKCVFVAIGQEPEGQWLGNDIKKDSCGYIIVDPGTCKSSIPGVFAAGDVCDPRYRQAITAAASGCRAALEAYQYLNHLEQEVKK